MQIIVGISLLLILATVIIYNVNDKFEKKEFIILLIIIIIGSSGFILYENSKEKKLPNLFIEKYEQEYKKSINSLDYELLNNKVVSSKDRFVYKFIYTITKDDKEQLCILDNVFIHRVKKEFVFTNFNELKEECISK